MSIKRAEKKLREAEFFLAMMRERLQRAFGDKEPIDFCLSAFLGASKSIDYMLNRVLGPDHKKWRAEWESGLVPANAFLHRFFADDRDLEIHCDGSTRIADTQTLTISNEYSDASGRLQIIAPPDTPPATVELPHYWFEVNGARREATEACAEYLDLVRAKLAQFRSDHA